MPVNARPVARTQRYTSRQRCPICGGHDDKPPKGEHCYGFISDDGAWAYCTRAEHANCLPFNAKASAYRHKLRGECRCGQRHDIGGHPDNDPIPPAPAAARRRERQPAAQRAKIVAQYDYLDAERKLRFQVVRYDPKAFKQRRPDGKGGWLWNLEGVELLPYRYPDVLAVMRQEAERRSDRLRFLFIVEGEKDVDRAWAAGLVATCNPMGALKWRDEFTGLLRMGEQAGQWTPVVIPDLDPDDPNPGKRRRGQRHAAQVADSFLSRRAWQCKVLELPGLIYPQKDLSDWLDAGNDAGALLGLAALAPDHRLGAYAAEPPPGQAAEEGEDNGAAADRQPDDELPYLGNGNYKVSRAVIRAMLERGEFVKADDEAFFFNRVSAELLPLDGSELALELFNEYRVNSQQDLYKYLLCAMSVEAALRGRKSQVHQFSHYDSQAHRLYFDLGKGRMLRLDGQAAQELPNGSDGVLFRPGPRSEPWKYLPDTPPELLRQQLIEGVSFAAGDGCPHEPDEQKLLLEIWLLGLAFESIQPTKPLALFIGPPGSGKSTLARYLFKTLIGPRFNVTKIYQDKEEDFWVQVTNSPLVVIDNADDRVKWLEPALATLATGIEVPKRVKFTTNDLAVYPARCFLALTAHKPEFRAGDVAERSLIFRLANRAENEERGFDSEFVLIDRLLRQRDAILSAYVNRLRQVMRRRPDRATVRNFRMADFARVAEWIGDGLGQFVPTVKVLQKMRLSQSIFATEQNPLVALLEEWLDREIPGDMMGHHNEGRVVKATVLFGELQKLAKDLTIQWWCKHPNSMATELRDIAKRLPDRYKVEEHRSKKSRGLSVSRVSDAANNEE